jgi:hypothetical protein
MYIAKIVIKIYPDKEQDEESKRQQAFQQIEDIVNSIPNAKIQYSLEKEE